jgi:hypothetical protein
MSKANFGSKAFRRTKELMAPSSRPESEYSLWPSGSSFLSRAVFSSLALPGLPVGTPRLLCFCCAERAVNGSLLVCSGCRLRLLREASRGSVLPAVGRPLVGLPLVVLPSPCRLSGRDIAALVAEGRVLSYYPPTSPVETELQLGVASSRGQAHRHGSWPVD